MLSEYLKQVHRHFALARKLASSNYPLGADARETKLSAIRSKVDRKTRKYIAEKIFETARNGKDTLNIKEKDLRQVFHGDIHDISLWLSTEDCKSVVRCTTEGENYIQIYI